MAHIIPIIKIVGNSCNLRCDYCFYHETDQSTNCCMSYELLEKFLIEYMNLFVGHLVFIWHGGEPLLAGLPFFRKIIEIQSQTIKNNQEIQNLIQTNATLINEEWAEFFKEYDFKVGISLDGDKKSHDRFRKNCNSKGSFDQVLRGTKILRAHNIEPGIIQTLTASNLSQTQENFNFFTKTIGAKGWSTNIYLDINNENQIMSDQSLTNKQLAIFLIDQIDLWLDRDDPMLKIREVENFTSAIFGKKSPSCAFNGHCARYFCLEHDGKVYPCDRSSGRPDLLLGDMSKQSLLEILNSAKRLDYAERVNNLPLECLSCEWQKSCNNGCTMHRVGGVDGKYYFCEARKIVFTYLKNKILKIGFYNKSAKRKEVRKDGKRYERATGCI